MTYLDYSATTPVNEEVLDTYIKVTRNFIGNPNSLHSLGVDAKKLIDASTTQIANILKVNPNDIIYTSGASESNNLAIKGICLKYFNRGKHIITTKLEHSSVSEVMKYLETLGFKISYVSLKNGIVDLDELEKLITEDTILVSICSINSETGIRQPVEEIGKIIKKYSKVFFHSDITQSIGKEYVNLENIDLASFSSQKFYGMKGIGCLIKKSSIIIEPLIHGGKSTTIYRSGTPATALIVSMAKALRLVYEDFSEKQKHVIEINKYLMDRLKDMDIYINSNENSIPNIINISLKSVKSETMLHALEKDDIFVSTQTACSDGNYSISIYSLYDDIERASKSLRISLSYLTTYDDIDKFLLSFTSNLKKLDFLGK